MKKPGVLSFLFAFVIFASCAPTISLVRPPESYKGPIAEKPVLLQGEYWVFERGNLAKVRSTALAANIEFPLWVGKTWRYYGEALRMGQPASSKAPRFPTRIDCYVTAFKQFTVTAGTFEAFECECRCELVAAGRYEPGCGEWTIWYAPEVKNVLKMKTESTASSLQLVEYRVSDTDQRRRTKDEQGRVAQDDKAPEIPAKIARTVPEDGSENVPTSTKEIVIVFDQPMARAWSFNCSPSFYPDAPEGRRCSEGGTQWRDDRTFVIQLNQQLKPNQRYSLGINASVSREKYDPKRVFRGLSHSKPAVPQRFFFTTGP